METNATSLKLLLRVLKVAPAVYERIQTWKLKPNAQDRRQLVQYTRRLDERRVFSARFNIEVVEACVASISATADFTDETLAKIDHPGARAVLASILDRLRQFLDRWGGFITPWREPWPPTPGHDLESFPEFFKDLGELRGTMAALVAILADFEPDARAPSLTANRSWERTLMPEDGFR